MTTFVIDSPEEMAELGTIVARQLEAGDLVLLNGELGAGKTTLTRAIGEALGIRGTVTSPTFVLARTHPRLAASASASASFPGDGSTHPHLSAPSNAPREEPIAELAPLVHIDAYRLSTAVELDDLDIDFATSIVVVEWGAGLLDGVSPSWLNVDIVRPTGAGNADVAEDDFAEEAIEPRTVTVTGFGPKWADMGWLDVLSD
ncbi:tRNA (adenosine(37)-N6)-threonylcarbamoyltransferase complex ATPase subunit type 1 TsaE [Salinibacterium sp. PAMC 21357]|uniref:tRNA (adenosine(37)-N6)-threonylcarbamoyltransferase complex ATPase subunit type 1 TsaE n=1 Tax=Salinibacterium sp. PAMC 21357 TaxID=1112215 RepID=UPI0002899133|nr:tRNA (adenosine(37)-N6)-threonylcarbamoyltransferase complex ATPase subunit type 1 TsaE [Salinibacterium sp. PAMC 21357]